MRTIGCLLGLLGLFCCLGNPARAQTQSALERDGTGWRDLQPAASLAGWTRLPIPWTNTLGRQQWHVDAPGVLVCDGDCGHDMLRFNEELTNGIFHVEFRFPPVTAPNPKYNSGVFIRNSADGKIWHQAQLTMDGGYLFGNSPVEGTNQRFKTSPTERRMKAAGQWNVVELTAQGKVLKVWLNGVETCVWDQCAMPAGFIAVEAEGYHVEFRNLKYKSLP